MSAVGVVTRTAVALLLATSTVVLGGTAARADVTMLSPSAWADFLTAHPELKVRAAAGAGGTAALGAAGGALEAGAFYLGYTVGHDVLGPALFGWAFGSGGDSRTMVTPIGDSGFGWGDTLVAPDPATALNDWPAQSPYRYRFKNLGGTTRVVTEDWSCVDLTGAVVTSGTTTHSLGPGFDIDWGGGGVNGFRRCGFQTIIGHRAVYAGSNLNGTLIWSWTYDPTPNNPWEAQVDVQCRTPDGTIFTASGGQETFTPAGSSPLPYLEVPSCAAITPGSTPEVLTVVGGRTNEPAGIVVAVPAPAEDPSTVANPQPSGGGLPGTGTNPATGPAPGANVSPESAGCWGSGWSWNPVSWVFVPVKCALQWAFVPAPGYVSAKVETLAASWGATAPAQYLTAFGGLFSAVGGIGDGAGGCTGPTLNVSPGGYDLELQPLNACPGSILAPVAPVVRVLLLIGLYLGGATVAARVLASSVGLQLPSFGDGSKT